MTFAELKAQTFRRLREVSPGVFASEADIEQAINEGYQEISDATEWCERWQTIDLLRERPYYDLRTVVGPSLLAISAAYHEDNNRWLVPTSLHELDGIDRRWEARIGPPERLLTRGLWWLGYWPRAGSDSGTIKQYYISLPDALADDDEEPGFPEPFHEALADFAVADLVAQDAEAKQAMLAWDSYLAREAGLRKWVRERAEVQTVRGSRR